MKILAIGATSYIGGHAVALLSELGHEIDVLTRNPSRVSGMESWQGVRLLKGDPTDDSSLNRHLQAGGYEACVNYLMGWGETPSEFLQNDALVQLRIVEAAARHGVSRYVFTSSVAAYGEYRHQMEETQWQPAVDNYGASKSTIERFLVAYARSVPMRINICRPGIIFGESPVAGIPAGGGPLLDIARKARTGERMEYAAGAGAQLIHARDLARCYLAFLQSNLDGEIVHTLGEPHIEFSEIAEEAGRVYGTEPDLRVGESESSESPKTFTLSKLASMLGLRFDPRPQLAPFLNSLY